MFGSLIPANWQPEWHLTNIAVCRNLLVEYLKAQKDSNITLVDLLDWVGQYLTIGAVTKSSYCMFIKVSGTNQWPGWHLTNIAVCRNLSVPDRVGQYLTIGAVTKSSYCMFIIVCGTNQWPGWHLTNIAVCRNLSVDYLMAGKDSKITLVDLLDRVGQYLTVGAVQNLVSCCMFIIVSGTNHLPGWHLTNIAVCRNLKVGQHHSSWPEQQSCNWHHSLCSEHACNNQIWMMLHAFHPSSCHGG